MKRISNGFTLLELLIVMVIAAIIMSMAIPSFTSLIARNKTTNYRDLLFHDVSLARNSALSGAASVSICSADTAGTGCSNSTDWLNGWLVFSDMNADGVIDTGDDVLRSHAPLQGDFVVVGVTHLTYRRNGFLSGATGGTFSFCHSGYATPSRVVVSSIGRPRIDASGSC